MKIVGHRIPKLKLSKIEKAAIVEFKKQLSPGQRIKYLEFLESLEIPKKYWRDVALIRNFDGTVDAKFLKGRAVKAEELPTCF